MARILLACTLLIAFGQLSAHTLDGQMPLPQIIAQDLFSPDTQIDIFAQANGRAVYLSFWGYWCDECANTFSEFQSLQRNYSDDIAIFAVAVGADKFLFHNKNFANKVKEEQLEEDYAFQLLWLTPEQLSPIEQIERLKGIYPMGMLIDANRHVVKVYTEVQTEQAILKDLHLLDQSRTANRSAVTAAQVAAIKPE